MFIDLAFGILCYVGASFFFGRAFDLLPFLAAIFFAFSPDLDMIPYLLLRKRLRLVSHHIMHYPIVFVAAGVLGTVLIDPSGYLSLLFFAAAVAHFIHDTCTNEAGIKWLWPFGHERFALRDRRVVKIPRDTGEKVYREFEPGINSRTAIDEVVMRFEGIGLKTGLLIAVALLLLILFAAHR